MATLARRLGNYKFRLYIIFQYRWNRTRDIKLKLHEARVINTPVPLRQRYCFAHRARISANSTAGKTTTVQSRNCNHREMHIAVMGGISLRDRGRRDFSLLFADAAFSTVVYCDPTVRLCLLLFGPDFERYGNIVSQLPAN